MTASCAAPQHDAVLRIPLSGAWEMTSAAEQRTPDELHSLRFIPAQVPGTAASALRKQGAWQPGSGRSLDEGEYRFRCTFDSRPAEPGEEIALEMNGIATLSEVWLNGRHILNSSSMFASHRVNVSELLGNRNELLIACRPLATAHSTACFGVEQMLGRFVDASYAYRFGPPGHDLIAASLHLRRDDCAFAQAFRPPAGRTSGRVPISALGITGEAHVRPDGSMGVLLQ